MVKPDNFLVWSILSTVLCSPIFGIVAIVYAAKVDSHWYAGRHAESIDAAKKAKLWTFISVGTGIVFTIIYTIIFTFVFSSYTVW